MASGRPGSCHGARAPSANTSRRLLLAAVVATCATRSGAFGEAPKYLIASAPRIGTIAYMQLPETGGVPDGKGHMKVLVSGLKFPQGIAVDQFRKRLFVADPNLGKLVAYPIRHDSGKDLSLGDRFTVADNVEVRSVAVDGLGNVFFTEEPRQLIMRVTAGMIEAGVTTPEIIYDRASEASVSAPGGIALDNYFVYWLNKASGEQVGTVVRALQDPRTGDNSTVATENVVSLSANAMKCYGLCLALGNIFYTDENYNLYGIPRAATARHRPVTISSTLREPRGCAYDGDGTVYVADKDHSAIFQFASNVQRLSSNRVLSKAADLEGAFGVAVYVRVMP